MTDISPKSKRVLYAVVLLLIVVIVVVLLRPRATPTSAGRELYVSLSGSDSNNGSAAAPWRHLSHAVSLLTPGDRLCVGAGLWSDPMDTIDSQFVAVPSGTDFAGGAITIGACNGDVAVVRPPNGQSAIRLTAGQPHHLIVQDLTLDMSNNTTVAHSGGPANLYLNQGAHHNRFNRLIVQNNLADCIEIGSSSGVQSPYNEVRSSTIHTCGLGAGGGSNDAYAFYVFTDDTVIEDNDVYDVGGFALTVYGARHTIRNNRIHAFARENDTSYGIVIGSSAHPTPSVDSLVANNLIYGSGASAGGIMLYTGSGNITVAYNTVTGLGLEGIVGQYYAAPSTIRNNIVYGNGNDGAAGVVDYGGTGPLVIDHNLTTDPLFVDAANGDFRLRPESPAADAGLRVDTVPTDIVGTIRPQGQAPDLGGYEMSSGTGPTPPDPTPPPTTGATRAVLLPKLSATVEAVTTEPAVLNTVVCANPNGDRVYVQLFDSDGVVQAGTVAPGWSLGIAPGATLPLTRTALGFHSAIRAAATTTAVGTRAPAVPITCNFGVFVRGE